MKKLMLMRHSHAVSNNPAFADHERPLTVAGRELAAATAKALKSEGLVPDSIICSSATRTRETAKVLSESMDSEASFEATDELYLARPHVYPTVIRRMASEDDDVVMALGHNPGVANLVNSWTDKYLAITPASVAVFVLDIDSWSELQDASHPAIELTQFFTDGVLHS